MRFSLAMVASVVSAGNADYRQGGADWGSDYPLCSNGKEQSPINLTLENVSRSENMELNGYGYRDFSLSQNDENLKRKNGSVYAPVTDGEFHLNFADGSKSIFQILQFHFHAPSEHTVEGLQYDLELHLVHKDVDSKESIGAVIGILFDRTAGNYENDFLTALWSKETDKVNINLQSFLSNVDFSEYWNYPGSLTTPPCTEGIKWTVIRDV